MIQSNLVLIAVVGNAAQTIHLDNMTKIEGCNVPTYYMQTPESLMWLFSLKRGRDVAQMPVISPSTAVGHDDSTFTLPQEFRTICSGIVSLSLSA